MPAIFKLKRPYVFTKTLPVVGQEAVESKRNFPVPEELPAAVNPPDQLFVPDSLRSPVFVELKVRFLPDPEMLDEIIMFPVLSTFTALVVALASTTPIVFPVPVSLFCRVKSLAFELFLRIVLATLLMVAPFNVKFPAVPDELPIVRPLVLENVISIEPIDKAEVPILIPAVVADPVLLNCATLAVVHEADVVLGDQFPAVYQAVPAPELLQEMVWLWAVFECIKSIKHNADKTGS